MRTIVLFWAYIACTGHGRRLFFEQAPRSSHWKDADKVGKVDGSSGPDLEFKELHLSRRAGLSNPLLKALAALLLVNRIPTVCWQVCGSVRNVIVHNPASSCTTGVCTRSLSAGRRILRPKMQLGIDPTEMRNYRKSILQSLQRVGAVKTQIIGKIRDLFFANATYTKKAAWQDLGSDRPRSAVGLDGGDVLSGLRVSDDELRELVETACSTTVEKQIILQYYPGRFWLWKQWTGTVVRSSLIFDGKYMALFAALVSIIFCLNGKASARASLAEGYAGLLRAWRLLATITTFVLSFFLNQSYQLWRMAYSICRRVQGRLNDIGLLCATYARRDNSTGAYAPEAEEMLQTVSRWIRLFHYMFYASINVRFAPLKTPNGLSQLVRAGALTNEELEILLQASEPKDAVILWMSQLFDTAFADGRLSSSSARARGAYPIAVQVALQKQIIELRLTYASLKDELTGRMPLAYVQLVQIITDAILFCTPMALTLNLGSFGALFVICGVVLGTTVVTLFYSSIVNLAKLFLDPLNNEMESRGGDMGIGGINVATLLQETNIGSEKWRRSATNLPETAWSWNGKPPQPAPTPEAPKEARDETAGSESDSVVEAAEPVKAKAKSEPPWQESESTSSITTEVDNILKLPEKNMTATSSRTSSKIEET